MSYRSSPFAFACCSAVLSAIVLYPQTTPSHQQPYIATSKRTVYVVAPGKPEVVKDVIRTIEARDSQGRRYSTRGSQLPPQFRIEFIRDVVAGRSYEVNRYQKVAYFNSLDPSDSMSDLSKSGMPAVEIKGVRCFKGPARQVKPDGGSEVIGTTCVSAELGNLLVHDDHTVNLGGEDLHIVTELEDIQLNTEPPATWFEIPSDFRLVPGSAGRPSLKP